MWHREISRDFFWVGFLLGAVSGGLLGVVLGAETGRRARRRLAAEALKKRSHLNGTVVDMAQHPPENSETTEQTAE